MLSAGPAPTSQQEERADIDNVKCVLQAEHEKVQNRTFTNWVNAQLAKHKPPSVIQDLFQDLRDGHRLLDLLEVLSGQQLAHDRAHSNPIHWMSNVTTALNFLRSKSIKLVNINVLDIVDGNPTVILGLIWSIILYFQVEKLASGLTSRQTPMEPSPALNSSPAALSPQREETRIHAGQKKSAETTLLQWVQEKTEDLGFVIRDFSTSWRSGLAFVAIINALRPGLVDLAELKQRSDTENLEMVFKVAEQELKIPRLLEAQDIAVSNPDEKSIITYISQFLQYSKEHAAAEDTKKQTESPCLVGSDVLCAEPAQVGEHTVSEAEVKRDFEESKRRIEACIGGAMQFLEDRGSPEELIVKHQETIRSFDSGIIEHFLEATDKIKMILTPQKKRIVEEMRAELCRNWEKVLSLVDAHLHRMKFEVEQNKFNAALQECEDHQRMDSPHVQSLLEGHQVGSDVLCAEPAQVGECTVSEADVKRDFEESKRGIEACIGGAMQFLEDRGSPEELIVKHQETIRSFDSGIIEHFLEATDKIKMILTPQKKRIVEEMRAELCRNWEKVLSLVDAHLHRMKFEVEQNKFNAALQECEDHQRMDSSHVQSLLEGHQVGSDVLCAEPAQVGERTVSEADVKRDFEDSKRRIEACIGGAMQFLEDRGSPEELIVKHQETIRSFDSGIIEHFLEATDKIKMILTPQKKRIVEEMRAELCRNWEEVLSLVDAHLHRMKFEVEQNKFNAALQECEDHQRMDSSHVQSLHEGHQMSFSKGSSLTRAQQHLAAMRELCDGNVDAEIKATLQSCEDRKTDLEQRLIKCFSWFQDPVSSPQTGELKSERQREVDLTEAATRKAPSGRAKRQTEQADDPGGENSAQPVTKVGQASTQLGAAEPNRNILVDIGASEIPGPWTEWIRIDDLGREGQTQSVQETQRRKLQGDWLQRGDCQQSVTHCLTDGEPPATVKGEHSGQHYSMSQRGDTEAPGLNFTQLQMQSSSGEDQGPAQAMGSHTDLVAISSRSQGLADDSGQLAKYLLMGKCEMEMFPNVDITHLEEDSLSGQGQGETTDRGGSALLASAFPSKKHQGCLQTRDCLAQSQKEKTGQKALDTARTEKPAQVTFMALSKEEQAAHRGTKAIAEFSKGFLTEQLSLTGRDQGEDIPVCVEVSLSEEEQLDKPTVQATVEWPGAVQDQSDVSDTLFGRKQGESLTLCDKESLIGADQTDPCTMKSSVNLNGAIQTGQEQTGEYHIEGNQTLMRELPSHDNPEFVFDQEQTISATTERTVQLPKENSSGIDQAYGLLEDGSQKSTTVSVSERELTGNQSRRGPTQLSTSSPIRTGRCDHPTMAGSGQLSELALSGDIKVCDLPEDDSGQLLPDSVSEEGIDADLTAEDSAQSGRECLMEKELNLLESEEISQLGTELHSGKVQTLGPLGVDSPECLWEGEHVDRATTGSSAPLMTMTPSGQLQGDATVMEDSAGVSGKDLSERDKADGLVSDVSPGPVTEPLSGEKQTENAVAQDIVRLVRSSKGQHEEIRESMTSGKWGDDLTLTEEEILIRADQTDACKMKDSVNWEGLKQGEHELTGGHWGKVSPFPKIGAIAVQDEAYGLPSNDTDRLPISEQTQTYTAEARNIVQSLSEQDHSYGLLTQAFPQLVEVSQSEGGQTLMGKLPTHDNRDFVFDQEQKITTATESTDQLPKEYSSGENQAYGLSVEGTQKSPTVSVSERELTGNQTSQDPTQLSTSSPVRTDRCDHPTMAGSGQLSELALRGDIKVCDLPEDDSGQLPPDSISEEGTDADLTAEDSAQSGRECLMEKELNLLESEEISQLGTELHSGKVQTWGLLGVGSPECLWEGEHVDRATTGSSAPLMTMTPSGQLQGDATVMEDSAGVSGKDLSERDKADGLVSDVSPGPVSEPLSGEKQTENAVAQDIVRLVRSSKGQHEEIRESMTSGKWGDDLTLTEEEILIRADQTDPCRMKDAVNWEGSIQGEHELTGGHWGKVSPLPKMERMADQDEAYGLLREDTDRLPNSEQTQTYTSEAKNIVQPLSEQDHSYGLLTQAFPQLVRVSQSEGSQTLMGELPTHDNPDFVFDQEQTITAATESTDQLPKEYSSGVNQAYGLSVEGTQKSPIVSVSERELTGNQPRRGPTQLSTSSPVRTDRCDHRTMAGSGQLSELAFSGDIKVCDLPEDDSGQLFPDSVSEEGIDADLTAEDSAQSGRECLMEKELNLLELEKISQSGTELHSGKVQTLSPLGMVSTEHLREGEHGDRTTTGSSVPLMTMSLSGQLQGNSTVMEDSAGVSGKDLSESDKADGLVSDVSPGAVKESLTEEKQIEGQPEEIRNNKTGRKWGDDLTLPVEEILIRADQTDPCKMKDSVNWEGVIEGDKELTGGLWGKVSTPSKLRAMADKDEAYGLPKDYTNQLPISEQTQTYTAVAKNIVQSLSEQDHSCGLLMQAFPQLIRVSQSEGSQTLMGELPTHDNPDFVFDQEQTITAATESTDQLPKEYSSGVNQAYGLSVEGTQKSPTVSVSERELTGNQPRRGPTQLSTSSPVRTNRCDHPTMTGSGQLSELALRGYIEVCDLPGDDSGQLPPDSVSEEGTDADLTAENSAQSGRECLMKKELNVLESEEISHSETELHSGKVQALGPLGVDATECLREGEHGERLTTRSSVPLMTTSLSGQFQGDRTVMEDLPAGSGKDLSERPQADGLVSDTSPEAVTEPLSEEKQTQGQCEDIQESMTSGKWGEDLTLSVERILIRADQTNPRKMKDSLYWEGVIQGEQKLTGGCWGKVSPPPKIGAMAVQDDAYGLPSDDTDRLPISEQTQTYTAEAKNIVQPLSEQDHSYGLLTQAFPQLVRVSQSEGSQTLMGELPTHDNPDFVFDQEQTITAATESTDQLPKEYSSEVNQAYGQLVEGTQKSPTVSVSERELTGNQTRQDPTQLSTSSPVRTDRCDHPTMAGSGQLSELTLRGDIKVCDLPEDDSGQLFPDSVSEEGTDADLTAEDSAQSGRECLMEKELNLLESEEISQMGTELHSGKVQTLGPLGVGSPECLWEGEHGNRTTTGSSAPLMTMTPSGQLQGDATVMEDSAGVSGKDLSERDKADGLVSDVSPGAVSEPLSGEKQTENAVAQNTVGLVRSSEGQSAEIRENMTGRKWGDDLTLSVEEILIRADQTDPCKMKDSVKWEGAIQGEQELTGGCCGKVSTPSKIGGTTDQDEEYGLPRDDTDRLPISEQSEDDTPPAEMSVTGATQTMTQNNVDSLDWERMKLWAHEPTGDPGNPEHALPEPEGWTERQQAVALLRENSEPAQQSCFVQCTQDAVSEQEEAGRAGSRRHQPAELNPPGVQPLGAECQRSVQAIIPTGEMISPEVDVTLEPGLSGHFEGEPLSQVEQVKEASAESAPVFQIRADQTATPEGDAFPPRIHIPQNSKEMENSAQSVSCSSNAERQLSAGSAARLVRTLNEDLEPQDEGELTEKESTMTLTWPLADFSQSQMEYFECSNLTDDPVRKDSGKPVHSTEQEFADVMTLGLVDPSERAQQGKETRDEEDRRLADVERQDHNVKTGNEISERETSLRMAFTALESMKEQILSLHSSLVQFQNKPKVLTGFSFKLEPEVQMLKNLQTQVKSQIESCEDLQSRLSKASSMLEPEDQCAVSAVAVGHTQRCREIGSQAQLAEEALQALAQLLQLLQAAEQEGASQDDKLRLVEEEEGEEKTRLLQDRALELDKTLAAAKICLVDKNSGERTRCWDLASSLGCRSEAARLGLGRQHRATQEELHQAFCTRQNCLIKDLQEIGKRAEELRLREATCPGVQWRLRCLNDLNTELQSKASELKELRYLMEQLTVANPALRGEAQEHLYIAQCVLEETERNIHDRQDQCHMIVAFLRQYQNYKKELTATIQKGAAVLPGHTSYMGKEKLQRLMNDINDVKLEFNSQQGKVDELRKVCRHLQSELKKVMDCNSLPFQTEAEELLDQWLDESERLDSYSCNLQQALSLWQDLSESCSRMEESVTGRSEALRMTASGQELAMQEDEIPSQEKEIPSFQEKVVRIQELLGWKEIPLELQVVSTVKKKIEQVKHINKQLNTMDKAPTGHLSHSVVKHEPTGVPSESDGREQVLPLCLNREGVRPVFEFSVEGQQCSQHRLGAHEEMVWSGEDPSDDDITPTAEDLPETPCAQTDRVQEQGNDSHYLGETEQCRRQHQASEEETQAKRRRELWPVQVEQDQNMQPASKTPLQQQDTELEALEKYPEKLKEHVTRYRQLTEHLASLETSLTASTAQIPTSYKAAIEQAERQTALGREIDCIELKVLELKDKAHDLEGTADISNEGSASQAVSTLSGRWLRLRDSAREQELRCSGLREEWKSINEEIDRAMIVLDHLQDDLPDHLRQQAPMAELLGLEEYVSRYHGDLTQQQSTLGLLFQRVARVLNVQEPSDSASAVPVLQELRMMEERCQSLAQKIEKDRQEIEAEIREREKTFQEIDSVDAWLQQTTIQLDSTELHNDGGSHTDLEQLRAGVSARRQAMAELSGQLQSRYSEQDVPSEIATRIQETSTALTDMGAKLEASPRQDLSHRIVSITNGLHGVEKLLKQCSKTHSEAQNQQKTVWRAIDEWHSVLSELEAEVQELAQQDPEQAQQLMENLMEPLQLYQHVSHTAERRTILLNKIPDCLEEYKQITDSTEAWNNNAKSLLSSQMDYTSAKTVNKQLLALQVLAHSGKQKQQGLQDVVFRLKELSVLYQTEDMMERLNQLQKGTSTLQQKIDVQLAELEHVATELGDLESEVKNIENKLLKINTILSSIKLCDLPIVEHLENRQIILENLEEMKELVGMMEHCKETLGMTPEAICTVEVFTKIQRVSTELTHLQEVTTQQSTMLQSLLEKLQEYNTEMERLQQMGELYDETQGERLASLTERRELLLNSAQEALTQFVQDKPEGEEPVDKSSREEEQSATALSNLPWDSKVSPDGKLPSLLEEDEEHEEDEDIIKSGERNQTLVPTLAPTLSPLEDLHECQDRAAALERWLDTVQESLGECAGDQEMHQDVEEHLLQSQSALLEIEEKVCELAQAGQEGNDTLQPALEILSHRLGTLKGCLVTFEAKLRDGQNEGQETPAKKIAPADGTFCHTLPTGQPTSMAIKPKLSRQDSLQQQKELELELAQHKHLTEYIALHVDRMNQQVHNCTEQDVHQSTSSSSRDILQLTDTMAAELQGLLGHDDQVAATWQRVQQETEGRLKLLEDSLVQGLASQVSLTAGSVRSVRGVSSLAPSPAAAEELSVWVTQLGLLAQEATAVPTQGQGECVTLERRLQDTTLWISQWLDAAEERIYSSSPIPLEEAEQQLEYHQLLAATLERVHHELSEQCSVLGQPRQAGEQISALALQCLATLQRRLKLLQAAHSTVSQSLTDRMRHITLYQERLRQFEAVLLERRMDVRNRLVESAAQSASDQLQVIEKVEGDLEPIDAELLAVITEGQQYDLETTATEDLCKLEDILNGIRVSLREQWRQVQHTTVVTSQYERLLQALLGLVNSGQEKLSQGTRLLAKNIGDLRSQLQNHKLFFSRLANHLVLVKQFSQSVPGFIVTCNRDVWLELVEGVSALQAQALAHGIQMETAVQAWAEFEVDHSSLMKELELLKSSVPTVGLVEETEERLSERVSTLQAIRSSLTRTQAQVEQRLSSGHTLLGIVSCPELGTQVHNLEESWLSINNQVNHQLHRLEKLLEHCTRFQRESHRVHQWLDSARSRLSYWEQESVSLPSRLDTSENQLQRFLEFWKEVDGMSSVRTAAISTGSQLLALKQVEGGAVRTHLAQLEQKWTQLIAQFPGIQEKLHQLQVAVLPSRKAITQLTAWIQDMWSLMEKNEPVTHSLDSSTRVRHQLQKYKGYQLEVNCRQLMVDFVNQSVLQMSSQDVEGDRYERTEFAESLGTLNFQWQNLTQVLNRKILLLETQLESWTECDRNVMSLSSWLDVQQDRLRKDREACSQTAIGKALTDCQELGKNLKVKETELEMLRQTVAGMIENSVPETPTSVTQKLDQLQDSWSHLDTEVNQVQSILTSRQQLWALYQDSYQQVNGNIVRARYSLEHCTPLYSSLESVKIQLESLQALQVTLEGGEESWRKFQEVSQRLKQECCPALAQQLEKRCEDTHSGWIDVQQEITEQLRSCQTLGQLWQRFTDHSHCTSARLRACEENCHPLLTEITLEDSHLEKLRSRLTETQESICKLHAVCEEVSQVCVAADELSRQVDPSSSAALQSNCHNLSGRVSYLEASLSMKIPEIQGLIEQHEEFQQCLHALETLLNESEQVLKSNGSSPEEPEASCLEILKGQLLRLSSSLLHLETLNRLSGRLPIDGLDYTKVQALNRRWQLARATALDRCSKLQAVTLQEESFSQKCEHWRQFLERMEETLMIDVAGSYEGLKEQQETHELFQVEVSIAHQILDSIVQEAQNLIPSSDVQDRRTFVLNLSALKERWCRLVQKVWQRQHIITTLANQWCHHGNSVARLRKLLTDTSNILQAMGDLRSYSLQQLWMLLEVVKLQGRKLQRLEPYLMQALEVGNELLSAADSSAQAQLQEQLCQLQDAWGSINLQLTDKRNNLTAIVKMCDRCGEEVTVLGLKLQEFGVDLRRELPCFSEDLQKEQSKLQQELGELMRSWLNRLVELSTVKVDLGKHLIPDVAIGFQEQVAILESHWEQLKLSASLRTLEISDRLEQWVVFNTKSKHLEDWLKQMDDRVSQSTDSGVQEMIERLQEDCMGEINLYNRNKVQLKQLGDELIKASSPSKAPEIDNKLNLINRNWQHLHEVIEARVKKLKDTLCSEQLLDREMSNLRTWLSRIESELSKPVIYNICDDQEIEKKLAEQQELQRDIEQHSVGVTSVLNLCDSLLLDTDTESECDSIQQTTRSLDRRWRNICAMSVERRMKIEETWRLWQKFLEDYSRFDDWLKGAERTAAHPNSSQVPYSLAKEELKKFETFQRQIHESLTQLELINKQYRRLARENRTDSSSRLKQMVHEGNQRWDSLQKRIAAILRRLKHFISQREEFESCRECILVWLTEMDLQLTNVEHFSESDIDDKVRQLNAFQQEITLNTTKIDQLIVSGERLIWKIEPMDAVTIEEELEELHAYCQEVFGRVARFHQRLMSKRPMIEEKEDLSDREADTEDGAELQNMSWQDKADGSELSTQGSLCHLTLPEETQQHERSGGATPVSVDSIPLEWDHTVDVGGSSSHEDEDDGLYFSNLSGNVGPDAIPWHPAPSPEGSRKCQYQQTEIANRQHVPGGNQSLAHRHSDSYVLLQSDGSGNMVNIRRAADSLGSEISQQPELSRSEQPTPSIEHWQLLNAKALSEELVIKQNLQQWQQLNSDLDDISQWLVHIEPTLNKAESLEPSPQLAAIEEKLRSLRNVQKEFDKYKALVTSAKLSSREFLQTDSAEAQELQEKLQQVNGTWERTAQRLERWRASLRSTLTQCQDFYQISHSLVMWLADCERQRDLVQLSNPGLSLHTLTQHRKALMNLEAEMLERQPHVTSLQELSVHLLEGGEGAACGEAREQVHVIGTKLKVLLGEITADLQTINERLDVGSMISADELDFSPAPMSSTPLRHQVGRREIRMDRAAVPSSSKRIDGELGARVFGVSKARSFLSRVFRAAIPLQLLILLLLLLACLVPFTQEDYNCALANNFARSLYPMLRYTNGPPPT
ncbi:uncharacterized protein [Chiloscyllium punctatum]|uniref:uncharacterized protein isoform X4 n=1 Tax=Chiloscyllium punctatum TaxID=137246 RepID=UPI003B63FD82